MIPKIIWTTWVSDKPYPEKWQFCLNSIKRLMPDYEIRIIDKSNIGSNKYIDYFMKLGNYTAAGHYARNQRLYEYGGIYVDTDVEAIKRFDELLDNKCFVGTSGDRFSNNAFMGSEPGHPFMKECMDYMDSFDLTRKDVENETGPRMITNLLLKHGWNGDNRTVNLGDITVYHNSYFYPFNWMDKFTEDCIKSNTLAIHWWGASWVLKKGISVIIPTYNHADTVSRAIESAMKLRTPHEIIVINDGSTDNTINVVSKYDIKLINKENGGVSSARNAGIREASYQYILPLDADDELFADNIDKIIHNFDNNDCDILFGNMIVGSTRLVPNYSFKLEDFRSNNQLYQTSIYKKDVWQTLGGYWECPTHRDIFEDWDFYGRALRKGFRFKYLDTEFYRYNTNNRMTNDIKPIKEEIKQLVVNHIFE